MIDQNRTLIENLLKLNQPRSFKTAQEQLAWERGFLTGFLTSLIDIDPFVKTELIKKANKKK